MAKHLKIDELTKGNIWTITETELNQMLIEGKKHEGWAENETHYMNIIRPVFDIVYLDRKDDAQVRRLENEHYDIFSTPNEGDFNAIAIRKHKIKKITDLTLENISHLLPEEVLALIERNLGTGWKGLSLAIQDIIESAFFVDCAELPEYAMHRAGGLIDRRKEDGYSVLEIPRGNWIEGIFLKPKPKVEKIRFSSQTDFGDEKDDDTEEDDEELDNDDELDDDDADADESLDDEEDEEIMEDEDNPNLEDIDSLDVIDEETDE